MSAQSKPDAPRLRPSETILQYLESAAFSNSPRTPLRLPTIRELAGKLGVGVSTVGAVYRSLAQEGRIRTEVGNGSFLLPAASARPGRKEGLHIGIGLSQRVLRDPERWHSRVYGGITAAALHAERPAALVPLDALAPEEELLRQTDGLDALILMPGHLLKPALIEVATRQGIPCVYLNSPRDGETRNFVMADFAGASAALGRAFRAAGRKEIVMILEDPCHLSISAHFRVAGLLAGLHYGEEEGVHFRLEVANGISVEDGRRVMRQILEESPGRRPDAIYTSGDFLAIGCVEELQAHGICVPEEVSVAGGTGLNLERYSHPGLTCCQQPFEEIGLEIIDMVRRVIDSGLSEVPGRVVPMTWLGGATTLPKENRLLAIAETGGPKRRKSKQTH